MRAAIPILCVALLASGSWAFAQNQTAPAPAASQPPHSRQQSSATGASKRRSAKGDIGSGAGDIGKGAAGAAGNAAKGAGKGAVDLVTLHPINAAADLGKGAGYAAKDAGVGAAKGTGKIVKGTGRAIKHIF